MELAQEAVALDVQAIYHRRQAEHHRREARGCRQKQAEVEAKCRALGIEIVYREGISHGEGTAGTHHADRAAGHCD